MSLNLNTNIESKSKRFTPLIIIDLVSILDILTNFLKRKENLLFIYTLTSTQISLSLYYILKDYIISLSILINNSQTLDSFFTNYSTIVNTRLLFISLLLEFNTLFSIVLIRNLTTNIALLYYKNLNENVLALLYRIIKILASKDKFDLQNYQINIIS